MNFTRLDISDVILCESKVFGDSLSHFSEKFRYDKLKEFLGYTINFGKIH